MADYKGPIEVADVPGKGKGLVATRDIAQGTLLLVDKAFVISYPDEHQIEGDSIFLAITTNRIGKKDQSLTFQEAINKLRIMPTKTTEFYKLYAGPDYPRTTSGSDQLPTGWLGTFIFLQLPIIPITSHIRSSVGKNYWIRPIL